MKISKISNNNFNGWKTGALDKMFLYASQNRISSYGFNKIINAIDKVSSHYTVDFDATYGFPLLRAYSSKEIFPINQIKVYPGLIFNRTLKSCLKKMLKILEKENTKFLSK